VTATPESVAQRGLGVRLQQVRDSRLVRQNLVLFTGGLVAGVGGFVYHAVAGRVLAPAAYGEVAALVALFALVGTAVNLTLVVVLARYAADLKAAGRAGAIRHIALRTAQVIAVPALAFCALGAVLSTPAAAFLNLRSPTPVFWAGVAIAAYWFTAIPRGILQGTQHFTALSANLSLELVVRTACLALLLLAGLAVTGAMVAILLGIVFAFGLGLFSMRDTFAMAPDQVRLRTMARFARTAAAGTLGILLLYNVDVVLAEHYLDHHDAGIYGGLNKIGTILYFLTLSVSQVLFPRVVEAVATRRHPGRLLLMSGGIMSMLGGGAILVFGAVPGLVVGLLYGPRFHAAEPYILAVGFIGLGLSLDNLLVQFFMAVHDRVFVPILAAACVVQVLLIVAFHGGVGQIVMDVLVAIFGLLAALALRCLLLLPRLRPEMLDEAEKP
jgi:O-antigen/teichoic acid export membrane protein